MPSKDRSFHESPEKAGGEGWLYSEQQQKLCHFKPDTATVHAQWVAIRTYSYVPPRPPEPMTRRRLLRHNAIKAWQTDAEDGLETLPPASEVTQNFLVYGGLPAISTLISLQMFIHAPNPKFTPLGPSMNS